MALRLSGLATKLLKFEEGFLVYRFLKGVKHKGVRQILAAGQEDLGKVTVAQLNPKINNLLQAREGSESGGEPDSSSVTCHRPSTRSLHPTHSLQAPILCP